MTLPEQRPGTGIPKTIGILNIVFGSLLLLCVICLALSLAMQFAMGPMFAAQQQQAQQMFAAERQRQLAELQALEQGAANEKEKAGFEAKKKALQAQPIPKMPDMAKFTQDASFQVYGITDVVSGLILNILMVVSGAGLVSLKEWGRRLGLWVAAIKIVRLIALNVFFILVVVPNMTEAFVSMFQDMVEEMARVAPAGGPVPGAAEIKQMAAVMGIMYSCIAVGMIILGVIYPVIVLILLSRPHVKAACAPPALTPTSLQRE